MVNTLIDGYLAYREDFPDQPSVNAIEDGPVKDVKLTPTIELAYRLLIFLWSDIGIREDYLRKFLKKRRVRKVALFTLAREGEEGVERVRRKRSRVRDSEPDVI